MLKILLELNETIQEHHMLKAVDTITVSLHSPSNRGCAVAFENWWNPPPLMSANNALWITNN